jgi:hypothetical protein
VPLMIEAFDGLQAHEARHALLRAIAQLRSVDAPGFFESLLRDGDSNIWTTALDGVVSIGGQASLDVLTRSRVTATGDKCEWIDEAIEQLCDADGG